METPNPSSEHTKSWLSHPWPPWSPWRAGLRVNCGTQAGPSHMDVGCQVWGSCFPTTSRRHHRQLTSWWPPGHVGRKGGSWSGAGRFSETRCCHSDWKGDKVQGGCGGSPSWSPFWPPCPPSSWHLYGQVFILRVATRRSRERGQRGPVSIWAGEIPGPESSRAAPSVPAVPLVWGRALMRPGWQLSPHRALRSGA